MVVNLYPFRETVARADVTWDQAIENIDIGGPAMVRAAAKNHADVAVLTSPDQYTSVLAAMAESAGRVPAELRRRLALEAFQHTASYDTAISRWMAGEVELESSPWLEAVPLRQTLRYGENPRQKARWFSHPRQGWGGAIQLQGKELSTNNLLDLEAALATVREFGYGPNAVGPAAVVVKHTNPCGVAVGPVVASALTRALDADRVSAFGGIVAINGPVEAAAARRAAGDGVRDGDGGVLAEHGRGAVDALEERGRGVVVALQPGLDSLEPHFDVRRVVDGRPRQGVPVHRVVLGRQDLGRFEEAVAVGEVGQGVAHDVSVPQRVDDVSLPQWHPTPRQAVQVPRSVPAATPVPVALPHEQDGDAADDRPEPFIGEVKPPPGLTLGDFPARRATRFGKKPVGIRLTNSYSMLQCCEQGECDKCEVKEERKEERSIKDRLSSKDEKRSKEEEKRGKGEEEKRVISARFGCQLFSARLGSQIVNFPSCCCGLLIELGLPHLFHL